MLLLLVISMSFVIENSYFWDRDSIENVENTEKENTKKEKKLLFDDLNIDLSANDILSTRNNDLYFHNVPEVVHLELSTPPPKVI